jgi:hypothetical protein
MVEEIHDLKLVCGDPRLPGDLAEIPGQPQHPLDLDIQVQHLNGEDWQGSVLCDGHEVYRGRVRRTYLAAWQDAEHFADNVTKSVLTGLLEDFGRRMEP